MHQDGADEIESGEDDDDEDDDDDEADADGVEDITPGAKGNKSGAKAKAGTVRASTAPACVQLSSPCSRGVRQLAWQGTHRAVRGGL